MSTTRLTRHIRAPRERVYKALLDADAVQQWMVPTNAGKTNPQSDSFHGRFVKLEPDSEIVQDIEFESDDPAMAGEMTITYTLTDTVDGDTRLVGVHENLPPGLSPAQNELGWRMSIDKLAKIVETLQ